MRYWLSFLGWMLSALVLAADRDPLLDRQLAEQRLAQAQAKQDGNLEAIYKDILSLIGHYQRAVEDKDRLLKINENFPARIEALNNQITRARNEPRPKAATGLDEIQAMILERETEAASIQVEQTSAARALQVIEEREKIIPAKIAEWQRKLNAAEEKLSVTTPEADFRRASEWQQQLTILAAGAVLEALHIEQASAQNRRQLLYLEQDLLKVRADNMRRDLDLLEAERIALRRTGTEKLVEEISARQRGSSDVHYRAEREMNRTLLDQIGSIDSLITEVTSLKTETKNKLDEISLSHSSLQEQLALLGAAGGVGSQLRDVHLRAKSISIDQQRVADISRARLERLNLAKAQEEIREQLAEAEITSQDLDSDALVYRDLMQDRAAIYARLINLQDTYIAELVAVRALETRLEVALKQLLELTSKNLLWVANTTAIDTNWLRATGQDFAALGDRLAWWGQTLPQAKSPATVIVLCLSLLLVIYQLVRREPLLAALQETSDTVGKVNQDSIGSTFLALYLTVRAWLIFLLPFVVIYTGLKQFGDPELADPMAELVHKAVRPISFLLFFGLMLVPGGVLRGHFRLNAQIAQAWFRITAITVCVIYPFYFLFLVTALEPDGQASNTVGRLCFMLMCLALIAFVIVVYRKFRATRVLLAPQARAWFSVFLLLIFIGSAVSLLLSGIGYFYSAILLMSKLSITLELVLVFTLIYLLVRRFLLIQERRLAFEQAKAKRAELLAHREKEKQDVERAEYHIEVEEVEVDIDSLQQASLRFIRFILISFFVLAEAIVLSEVTTSIAVLEDYELWRSTAGSGEQLEVRQITALDGLIAVLVIFLTWVFARYLPGLFTLTLFQRFSVKDAGLNYAINKLTTYAITLAGTIAVVNVLGFPWSKLQWLVAALGVGLGFGLQEIVANLVSGLILLFERPIRPGDIVTIGDLSGTVSKIKIRATTIIDWDRKEIVIPNKAFITERFINWSLSDPITRIVIPVGVAYGSDTLLVEQLIQEAATESNLVLETPAPEVFFSGFGNSTLDFELRIFTDQLAKRLPARHHVLNLIDRKFREHGVVIAFPQLDVHLNHVEPPKDNKDEDK